MCQKLIKLYENHVPKLCIFRDILAVCLFVFCLTQLNGCSFISKHLESEDGPPRVDIDVSRIPNAVPRVEPYHSYGTRDYVVGGRRYHVLKTSKGYVRCGYASWYGSKFHGNATATQERYNLYSMTAASKELPLPTYVEVTNLRNGRSVIVRVNDRGPFHSSRIIDLSYAAAKKLGFVNTGVAYVKVVAIDPKTWGKQDRSKDQERSSDMGMGQGKYLQVGAFTKLENAKQLISRIAKYTDEPAQIDHNSDLYRVKIGPLANSKQCELLKHFLEEHGFNKIIVK